MSGRTQILVLAVAMSVVAAGGTLVALGVMYQTALEGRLTESV